jgi:hypothetical protein
VAPERLTVYPEVIFSSTFPLVFGMDDAAAVANSSGGGAPLYPVAA